MTNEELYMVRHLAAQIGTDMVDIVPRMGESDGMLIAADRNPNTNGARLVLGIEPGSRLAAIRDGVRNGSIKGILTLGEDLTAPGSRLHGGRPEKAGLPVHDRPQRE